MSALGFSNPQPTNGFQMYQVQDIQRILDRLNDQYQPVLIAASGALPANKTGFLVITLGSAGAFTLAAPTVGSEDGADFIITSTTAFAHVITATGLLKTGTASVNVATFAAFAGASLYLKAYNGLWQVISSNAITFS